MAYVTKTQIYLKVKKPLLERQRRARVNKSLEALKALIAEFQADDAILRLDKAEMLEAAIIFMRKQNMKSVKAAASTTPVESFRNGYINAVSEVSRVMAATPDISVSFGRLVMTHLGCEFKRLSLMQSQFAAKPQLPPLSPASSGYHSDCAESPSAMGTPASNAIWRPW